MSDFWIQDGETMLFIGDSITDCGRYAAAPPLGNGYVRFFADLVTARYPERKIRWMNRGIGGHRVTNLRDRWQDDVLYHKPDRLAVKIGINDLHSHLLKMPDAVDPERFRKVYDEVLDLTRRELDCPVLLITPFYISTETRGDTVRGQVLDLLERYIDTVVAMSEKYDTRLVRLQDVFRKQLQHRDPDAFCPEPVHPNGTGHLVIAQAILEELET
jgi:lysophospholipase L1-like esterase